VTRGGPGRCCTRASISTGRCFRRWCSTRTRASCWAIEWRGKLAAVAIEATTGWRWVARELRARGFEVDLVDPGRASALRGRRRQPKTDRLDARWLALLFARELLSECEAWLPPAEIQQLRDRTRLRKALAGDRTGWAQRPHALLARVCPILCVGVV
jgi:transposase